MDSIIPQKRCTACKEEFPATFEFFYREEKGKYGVFSRCKQCCSKAQKARAQDIRRYHKQYNAIHAEEQREYFREYNQRRAESHRLYMRHYTQCHMEQHRTYDRNREARKKLASGSHTAKQVREQYDRQRGKCYYCAVKLGMGKRAYHVDHTFPLSREGASNDISYLVITCPTCNIKKGNKYPWEWPEGGRLL